MKPSIHQFTVNDLYGDPIPLKNFEGKVLLIVNTASECGLTPQLEKLEQLYKRYQPEGLEILGFPSNDFNDQEPLEGKEIANFCQKNFGVTFTILEKVVVKGDDAHEVYQFLSEKGENEVLSSKPKWNFHKYLLNQKGEMVDYFWPTTSPVAGRLTKKIEKLLASE